MKLKIEVQRIQATSILHFKNFNRLWQVNENAQGVAFKFN